MAQSQFYYRNPDAPKPNQPPSIGVAALIERNERLLLERRSDSDRWAIIGRAIQQDESLLEGLVREVMEETGLTVKNADLLGTFSDPSRIIAFPDGNVKRIITIAYRVDVDPFTELVCSEESVELAFISKEALSRIPIAETHIPIVQAYLNDKTAVMD